MLKFQVIELLYGSSQKQFLEFLEFFFRILIMEGGCFSRFSSSLYGRGNKVPGSL